MLTHSVVLQLRDCKDTRKTKGQKPFDYCPIAQRLEALYGDDSCRTVGHILHGTSRNRKPLTVERFK
jgi:hypothetical protein